MKKAITWLEDQSIDFKFHDYKKAGIDETSLRKWLTKAPWDQLINRKGTTWRKLTEEQKSNIDDEKAIHLMMTNTSLIKRPVLIIEDCLLLGFKADEYEKILSTQ